MLHARNLPTTLWCEAVHTAAYVGNRVGTKIHNWHTQFELLTGHKPDVSHLVVFGTNAYAPHQDETRPKFASKTDKYIVVGYSSHNRKAYRLLNGRGVTERTEVLIFDETRVAVTAEPNQGHEEAAATAPELSLNTTASGSEAIESTEHDSSTRVADQQDIMPHERCAEDEEQSTQSGDREDRRYPSRIRHPPERWGAYSEANLAYASTDDPTTDAEADAGPHAPEWAAAREEELHSL
jgi:hypothetical protein